MKEIDMKLKTLIAASAISLLASYSSQADTIELGLLTCDIEGGVGFVIGSKKDLTCVFKYANSKYPDDLYTGTVKKFGLDVGKTGRSVVNGLCWAPMWILQLLEVLVVIMSGSLRPHPLVSDWVPMRLLVVPMMDLFCNHSALKAVKG